MKNLYMHLKRKDFREKKTTNKKVSSSILRNFIKNLFLKKIKISNAKI